MDSNSSEILLRRCMVGSATASFEIHGRYRLRLLTLARNRLMDVLTSKIDPEDVTQEVFTVFFEKISTQDVHWLQRGDLCRFLAGITINKVRSRFEFYNVEKRDVGLEVPILTEDAKTNEATEPDSHCRTRRLARTSSRL